MALMTLRHKGYTNQLPIAVEMMRDRIIKHEDIIIYIITLKELFQMMKKLFGPNDEIKVLVEPKRQTIRDRIGISDSFHFF